MYYRFLYDLHKSKHNGNVLTYEKYKNVIEKYDKEFKIGGDIMVEMYMILNILLTESYTITITNNGYNRQQQLLYATSSIGDNSMFFSKVRNMRTVWNNAYDKYYFFGHQNFGLKYNSEDFVNVCMMDEQTFKKGSSAQNDSTKQIDAIKKNVKNHCDSFVLNMLEKPYACGIHLVHKFENDDKNVRTKDYNFCNLMVHMFIFCSLLIHKNTIGSNDDITDECVSFLEKITFGFGNRTTYESILNSNNVISELNPEITYFIKNKFDGWQWGDKIYDVCQKYNNDKNNTNNNDKTIFCSNVICSIYIDCVKRVINLIIKSKNNNMSGDVTTAMYTIASYMKSMFNMGKEYKSDAEMNGLHALHKNYTKRNLFQEIYDFFRNKDNSIEDIKKFSETNFDVFISHDLGCKPNEAKNYFKKIADPNSMEKIMADFWDYNIIRPNLNNRKNILLYQDCQIGCHIYNVVSILIKKITTELKAFTFNKTVNNKEKVHNYKLHTLVCNTYRHLFVLTIEQDILYVNNYDINEYDSFNITEDNELYEKYLCNTDELRMVFIYDMSIS